MSKRILLAVTGSIAAYKAADFCSQLTKLEGVDIQVMLTQSATKFVGAATFEGLTGKPVLQSLWQPGQLMDHIHLGLKFDLLIVYPATANIIASLAQGQAHSLLTATCLALPEHIHKWIAPAMNTKMLQKETTTQANLLKLQSDGWRILPTDSGSLACGETGAGRLLEPEAMIKLINQWRLPKRRILVTGGGTRVPIDTARVLTNLSTGNTAWKIASELSQRGHLVTYVHSVSAKPQLLAERNFMFDTYWDLFHLLKSQLTNEAYDSIIHLAAVSDYELEQPLPDKIESTDEVLTIKLKKTPKILNSLKDWSKNKNIFVTGFKFSEQFSEQKMESYRLSCDTVIWNRISDYQANQQQREFSIFNFGRTEEILLNGVTALCNYLGDDHDSRS